jgi:DNA-binding CsgD family transcriptional regulator
VEQASKLFLARHASVSDAKLAYFGGDFERCLEVCANVRVRSVTTASEVALLTARALLRTGRPLEAQNAISDTRETHTTLDAWLTAQMLVATARIRQNDADAGIAMLVEAAQQSGGAHFAIRSEIAFSTALGYWAKRELTQAESQLALVDPRSDIIHARALELQAWCHTARCDFSRSAEFFRATLLRLDDCQASDRAIAASALSALATLAAELFDGDIARFVDERAQRMVWTSGISAYRYVTLENQALFHEFAGNTIKAYQFAMQAHESAATAADEVFGWALRSSMAHNAGEAYSAIVLALRARDVLATLNVHELVGEERFALLSVAEACAHFDPDNAVELFAGYCALSPIDAMLVSSDDPRTAAYETYVGGVIAQARGESEHAQFCYRRAFELFRGLGCVRRAVIAANALFLLTDEADVRSDIVTQLSGTDNYITKRLRRPADDAVAVFDRHPVVASLPRTQREVVTMICTGKTNKEIAGLRGVGEQTIKNMLTKSVFPAFGVSNRAELVSACLTDRGTHSGRASTSSNLMDSSRLRSTNPAFGLRPIRTSSPVG